MNKDLIKLGDLEWRLKGVQSVLYCMRQTLDEGTDAFDEEVFASVFYLLEDMIGNMLTGLSK